MIIGCAIGFENLILPKKTIQSRNLMYHFLKPSRGLKIINEITTEEYREKSSRNCIHGWFLDG